MIEHEVRGEISPGIHKSRWGFHPCDYKTFLLVKEIWKVLLKAERRYHAWKRWVRKMPKNRVIRRTIRNDAGQKVGSEVVGPAPEPSICAVFFVRGFRLVSWDRRGNYHSPSIVEEHITPSGLALKVEAARYACHPAPSPDKIRPLGFTIDELRLLAARLGIPTEGR